MLDRYLAQVRLLLTVLPEIARETAFALKGGTAIVGREVHDLKVAGVETGSCWAGRAGARTGAVGLRSGTRRLRRGGRRGARQRERDSTKRTPDGRLDGGEESLEAPARMPIAGQHLLGRPSVEVDMARVEPAAFIRRQIHFVGRDVELCGHSDGLVEIQNHVALLLVSGLDPETERDTSGLGRPGVAAENPMDAVAQCLLGRLGCRRCLSSHPRSLLGDGLSFNLGWVGSANADLKRFPDPVRRLPRRTPPSNAAAPTYSPISTSRTPTRIS